MRKMNEFELADRISSLKKSIKILPKRRTQKEALIKRRSSIKEGIAKELREKPCDI